MSEGMNVVDASGWLEDFTDGPDAAFFAQTLQEVDKLVVPTVSILDVFRHVFQHGDEGDARQAAAPMQRGRVLDLDTTAALSAGRLGIRHEASPSAGVVLAAARAHDARIWTLDEELRNVEGVQYRPRTGPAAWSSD
jgi:predicted nucleic acid-binding protein